MSLSCVELSLFSRAICRVCVCFHTHSGFARLFITSFFQRSLPTRPFPSAAETEPSLPRIICPVFFAVDRGIRHFLQAPQRGCRVPRPSPEGATYPVLERVLFVWPTLRAGRVELGRGITRAAPSLGVSPLRGLYSSLMSSKFLVPGPLTAFPFKNILASRRQVAYFSYTFWPRGEFAPSQNIIPFVIRYILGLACIFYSPFLSCRQGPWKLNT